MTPALLVDDTEHVELRQLDDVLDAIHEADAEWIEARDRAAAAIRENRTTWEQFCEELRRV